MSRRRVGGARPYAPMLCTEQTGLLVHVAHGTEVAPDDLEIGVLADVVDGHLEHAEVEVCDGAEGAARDEDEGLLIGIAQRAGKAVSGELVVGGIGEGRLRVCLGAHDGW